MVNRKSIFTVFMILSMVIIISMTTFAGDRPKDANDLPRPPKPEKSYTIGVLMPLLSNPHCLGHAYGYYEEAKALGAEVVLFDAGGYAHLDRQIQQAEDLISMPVDAIVIFAASSEGTRAVVDKAVEAGIPVVNTNVMTASEKVSARIRSDDFVIGALQAEYMANALNGKGKVLLYPGPAGVSWAMYRSEGYQDYMKNNCPDIEILEVQFSTTEPATGLSNMEDALLAYPDIDGVSAGCDNIGIGVAEAIFQAGKSGEIIVTTADSQEACLTGIREGKITATVVQAPIYMGRWGIRAAIMVLEGHGEELAENYWTPITVCTKDNIDNIKFEEIYSPSSGWKLP